jgi:hypothetical protein
MNDRSQARSGDMRWVPGRTFVRKPQANFWQGRFPWEIGNVWEWTSDWYQAHTTARTEACCTPRNPFRCITSVSRGSR